MTKPAHSRVIKIENKKVGGRNFEKNQSTGRKEKNSESPWKDENKGISDQTVGREKCKCSAFSGSDL
ncbi:MAG: hypothetical protein ACLUD0_08790 [Eubacterium ramulus]